MTEPGAPATQAPTTISPEIVAAILARHGLQERAVVPLANLSAGNSVYLLGEDLVLRVPHGTTGDGYALKTARIAITAARAAGVRTPEILVYDDTRELLPMPYALLQRVPGEPLSKQEFEPGEIPQVWRELGHDLALLHHGVPRHGPAGQLKPGDVQVDPRPWLEELAIQGLLSPVEAEWLRRWLDELQPLVNTGEQVAFCHGDVNADNVLVRPVALEYLALLDWDGAGWMDPAWDFVPLPLRAVPWVLQGYREVAEVPGESTAEARILWHHIQYTLFIWWNKRHHRRGTIDRGFQRLRFGIREMLELPGARWMAHLG
ncbi:MAG TPA: aminoglycoside phosphotransferase family protein [Chloroflexia bacterium]